MSKSYNITILKDKRCYKHYEKMDFHTAAKIFKKFLKKEEFYICINDDETGNPIIYKLDGIAI